MVPLPEREWKGMKITEINSGEYHVSNDPTEVITTLLGSCVAVCLFDPESGVGGMNHFMLPEPRTGIIRLFQLDARYGRHSLDLLLRGVLKKGARREALQAKVFGGGKMFESRQYNVPEANVEFAVNYLVDKEIPIIAMDVGGNYGRKIYYYLKDHRVMVKKNKTDIMNT